MPFCVHSPFLKFVRARVRPHFFTVRTLHAQFSTEKRSLELGISGGASLSPANFVGKTPKSIAQLCAENEMSKVEGCPDFRVQKGPKWALGRANFENGHAQLPKRVDFFFLACQTPSNVHTTPGKPRTTLLRAYLVAHNSVRAFGGLRACCTLRTTTLASRANRGSPPCPRVTCFYFLTCNGGLG